MSYHLMYLYLWAQGTHYAIYEGRQYAVYDGLNIKSKWDFIPIHWHQNENYEFNLVSPINNVLS